MKHLISGLLILSSLSVFAGNLSDSIPYPFYEVQKTVDGKDNKIQLLDHGVASLQKRIDIIRNAKTNIEVEYFIYATDTSAKLLTLELVDAAKRGVKVRMLIDKSMAVFVFNEFYAKALSVHGIEVSYYNASPLIQVSSINFRNHRKLISVDDKFAITGGRNVEDDYYDLSPDFNFLDRDIYVEGPIVKTIRDSFDEYFNSMVTEKAILPEKPASIITKKVKRLGGKVAYNKEVDNSKNVKIYEDKIKVAEDFLVRTSDDETLLQSISSEGTPILNLTEIYSCPEITYSTDRPGGTFWRRLVDDYSDDYRYLRKTLFDKVNAVDKGVLLSSPYLINNGYSQSLMKSLMDRGLDITTYTNSLASTDAVYVAANLYKDISAWAKSGINIYLHSGEYIDQDGIVNKKVKTAKWGTHSKTHIYDYIDDTQSEIMVGTYNIDNRSNHYNSEMAIFCKGNIRLTKELRYSMLSRMNEGMKVDSDLTATTKTGKKVEIYGANKDDLMLMRLISLPSWLLRPLL